MSAGELAGVRTGRASVNLLDSVRVDAYGTRMPLNQVASLSVPESTLIVAAPFDPSQMTAIENAVRNANLGLNPSNDGKVHPDPGAYSHRRATQGDVTTRAQARRGRPDQRASGAARYQRCPQAPAEEPRALRGRRAPCARRHPEAHGRSRPRESTICKRRRTQSLLER